MTRDPRAYLADVIEAGKAIHDAVATISLDDSCSSRLIRSALEREFMIIGEAMKQLSQRNPKLFASIGQGPEIIGFRNKLTHEYITIDNQLVFLGGDSIGASRSDERCQLLLQLLET
ncbi:MAG: DUF86 domain-containing protein [Steroidobacteraceae bacterium]